MIVMIDNYDSFTYNVYQAMASLYNNIKVFRNDEITIAEIEKMNPEALVISPGPSYPKDAGISVEAIKYFAGKLPIFGICLGHQSIGEAFGGNIIRAKAPMHGKASVIKIDSTCPIFSGLPDKITAARYHSLIIERETLPDCLKITAETEDGEIMAVAHKDYPIYGVQFHPESILAEMGVNIISNFLTQVVGVKTTGAGVSPIPMEKRSALKKYIAKAVDRTDLTEEEAFDAMNIIMSDAATPAQISAFLIDMRMKGETIEEITGFAKGMRSKAAVIEGFRSAIDIVGTGGDMAGTFNISTTSSFVIAAAGINVAKHGNRAASSKSGAADCLDALGVNIKLSPENAAKCLDKTGIAFLFAQVFHGAMRFVAPVRREIGCRTFFNILGPLTNPALADYIVLGIYDEKLSDLMANVLIRLGIKGAMVVNGSDGLDEITMTGVTHVCEVKNGKISSYDIDPHDYGFEYCTPDDLKGGTPEENARITLDILSGKDKGAKRNTVLLNAGCAIYCAGGAKDITEGVKIAAEMIDSGKALAKLNEMKKFTNEV
ncbi:MAG: bifunctional anthranilate synthase component II/anthranilate phosphoribosyltransferase [Oscillospiraceae bacterium]|nr:bifunctional anthranilate synthase component II/anthranilate phosphoribosyltransferase [Oscillospiraceae bacterium]MDY6209251.1 bifunctional anthranilate synthase component II/anthranilate phosphoribosyltransferase [Oscillospiraceae bacterium]